MTAPEFRVYLPSLVAHVGSVGQVGDEISAAAGAGRAVQTGPGAYGQLCQFVPALLNGLQQAMVDGMTTAAESVHETAEAVRSVVAAYDDVDLAAADRLRNP